MADFHLRIVTPTRTMFDRKVKSVQFEGVDGGYGILPLHAPLMTGMEPGIALIEGTDGTTEQLLLTDGFAEMRDNVLSLICDAGEMPSEIDAERAAEAEKKAREMIAAASGDKNVDLPRARRSLQKAMLRQMMARRSGTGDLR